MIEGLVLNLNRGMDIAKILKYLPIRERFPLRFRNANRA